MTLVYPELEGDQDRRQIIFKMLGNFPSLRQDVIMFLLENYEQEVSDISNATCDFEHLKGEE